MNVGANSWERDLRQLWYLYFEEEFEGDTRKSLAVSFIEFFNSKPEFLCEVLFYFILFLQNKKHCIYLFILYILQMIFSYKGQFS